MKKAIIILTIVGMVCNPLIYALSVISSLLVGASLAISTLVLYLFMITVSLTFGIISMLTVRKGIKKIFLGIMLIIFVNAVAGILYLCWNPDQKAETVPSTDSDGSQA